MNTFIFSNEQSTLQVIYRTTAGSGDRCFCYLNRSTRLNGVDHEDIANVLKPAFAFPDQNTPDGSIMLSDMITFAATNNFRLTSREEGPSNPTAPVTLQEITTLLAISNNTSLPGATRNAAYTPVNITAVGGNAPFTYAITAGSLPVGMTLSSAGVLSGTPTSAAATFNFTITATGWLGSTVSKAFTLVLT